MPPPTPPVVLVVLDGFGYRAEREGNAVALARTPTWSALWERAPRTLLHASGRAVGLPAGQMGNSEVGHLNLGAGRVVKQDLVRISEAVADGSFFMRPAFVEACDHVRRTGGTLHLMGLLGNGGVHALDEHLFALVSLAERERVPRVVLHALLDGRDTLPSSALEFMRTAVARTQGRMRVASLGGRYFGMDRDRRWERLRKWYDVAVRGIGPTAVDPLKAIRDAYARGETDEFITPVVLEEDGKPLAPMRDGDGVVCFNFRPIACARSCADGPGLAGSTSAAAAGGAGDLTSRSTFSFRSRLRRSPGGSWPGSWKRPTMSGPRSRSTRT